MLAFGITFHVFVQYSILAHVVEDCIYHKLVILSVSEESHTLGKEILRLRSE